jgi:hypothetical protein
MKTTRIAVMGHIFTEENTVIKIEGRKEEERGRCPTSDYISRYKSDGEAIAKALRDKLPGTTLTQIMIYLCELECDSIKFLQDRDVKKPKRFSDAAYHLYRALANMLKDLGKE